MLGGSQSSMRDYNSLHSTCLFVNHVAITHKELFPQVRGSERKTSSAQVTAVWYTRSRVRPPVTQRPRPYLRPRHPPPSPALAVRILQGYSERYPTRLLSQRGGMNGPKAMRLGRRSSPVWDLPRGQGQVPYRHLHRRRTKGRDQLERKMSCPVCDSALEEKVGR